MNYAVCKSSTEGLFFEYRNLERKQGYIECVPNANLLPTYYYRFLVKISAIYREYGAIWDAQPVIMAA